MGSSRTKADKQQLIAGLVAIGLSVAFLIGTVVCLRNFVEQLPLATTRPAASTDVNTAPSTTAVPGPTLAPNPYGPGDFAYSSGYLTCLAGPSRLGVDVSEYQGAIRWDQVAASDVEFAMIRLGFRAWGTGGELRQDARWEENLRGAADAGLQVGVYFFSQAVSPEEAEQEADMVLQMLGDTKLDLPVVFDWEFVSEDARTAHVSARTLNACALAFCRRIQEGGYESMVYFNQDLAKRMLDLQALQDAGFDFWLAMYSNAMTYPHKIAMWQYSSNGSVPGISGMVDMNLYFPYE